MKKALKIGGFVLLFIILAFFGINWYLAVHLESIVQKKLQEQVSQATNGFYRLEIGSLKIGILDGYLTVKDISLKPDSKEFERLQKLDSIPAEYVDIHIQSMNFRGVNYKKKDSGSRRLNFELIQFVDPQIKITHNEGGIAKEKKDSLPPKTLYEIISPILDEIRVKEVKISNGNLDYCVESDRDTLVYSLKDMNFHAENFHIDSTAYKRANVLYCEDFHVNIGNASHLLPGKSYRLDVGEISLGIKDSTLSIEKIALVPQYSKTEFAHKVANHPDWMDISIGSIFCKGIHIHDLYFNHIVRMDSLQIKDLVFDNFKNQKIIITHNKMPLIYEGLQKAPIALDIKSLRVINASVNYEELAKKGVTPGRIFFTDLNGDFTGFTNIVSDHKQYITLDAKGKLMGEGQINAVFKLPVDSLNDHFEVRGTMGPMNLTALNKIIEPLVFANIENGFTPGIDFHFDANTKNAQLNMQFLYKDLKVAVSKIKDNKVVEQGFFSMAANMILKHDNPDDGKEPRRVNVFVVRDPYHSTFNYFWQIFMPGVVETVGFTKERQKTAAWFKNEIDQLKGKKKKKK